MQATAAVLISAEASISLGEIDMMHRILCISHEQWPFYSLGALDAG